MCSLYDREISLEHYSSGCISLPRQNSFQNEGYSRVPSSLRKQFLNHCRSYFSFIKNKIANEFHFFQNKSTFKALKVNNKKLTRFIECNCAGILPVYCYGYDHANVC